MSESDNCIERVKKRIGIDINLITDFLILFSRFEFALKRASFSKSKRGKDIEPDWDTFFQNNKDEILKKLPKITDYIILKEPPKKQTLNMQNQLSWEVSTPTGDELTRLSCYIRRVRNNLFHGGKYNDDHGDSLRNKKLIEESIQILIKLSELSAIVGHFYDEPFNR